MMRLILWRLRSIVCKFDKDADKPASMTHLMPMIMLDGML